MGSVEFKSKRANLVMPHIFDISPEELNEVIQQGPQELCIIDVRTPDEFRGELSHIPNAQLVTLHEVPANLEKWNAKNTYVFICRSGARSAQATAFAKAKGLDAYNLTGGMVRWNELHFATTKE